MRQITPGNDIYNGPNPQDPRYQYQTKKKDYENFKRTELLENS